MNAISHADAAAVPGLRLDRERARLTLGRGGLYDPASGGWVDDPAPDLPDQYEPPSGAPVSASEALRWLADGARARLPVPVGVIGPREASAAQGAIAETLGAGLASFGLAVICGGRSGVMEAVCAGVARAGGLSIGLLPDTEPGAANPHVRVAIATGIGEARNALIARASLCLVAIGDSYGTLSEVALGRQFGKVVIGLAGAPRVDGVVHVDDVDAALEAVARAALRLDGGGRAGPDTGRRPTG
jgi:hypothetical protein